MRVLRSVLLLRLLPTVIACLLLGVVLASAVHPTAATAGAEQLPDLDQATPDQLTITRAGSAAKPVYRLGFRSAASNRGAGPLIISGHRPGPEVGTMVADQVVERQGAPKEVIDGVGQLEYVVSPDHRHWHLLGFEHYELRRAGEAEAVVTDRKTGFCLGDRYPDTSGSKATPPAQPVYRSRCGLDHPELLGIDEGISVGYGDVYNANLEGQYLPLTGLAAGRYTLVHRVNVDHGLRELDYTNNAASVLLELRWRRGEPMVRVLRSCPDSDRCTLPATPARRRR